MRPYNASTTMNGLMIPTSQMFLYSLKMVQLLWPMAYFNIPGCIHDCQVAKWSNIYAKLEKIFDIYGIC